MLRCLKYENGEYKPGCQTPLLVSSFGLPVGVILSLLQAADWLVKTALAIGVIWIVLFIVVQVAVWLWRANSEKDEGKE